MSARQAVIHSSHPYPERFENEVKPEPYPRKEQPHHLASPSLCFALWHFSHNIMHFRISSFILPTDSDFITMFDMLNRLPFGSMWWNCSL